MLMGLLEEASVSENTQPNQCTHFPAATRVRVTGRETEEVPPLHVSPLPVLPPAGNAEARESPGTLLGAVFLGTIHRIGELILPFAQGECYSS